ncbi:M48 family metalloprotease [Streptomyces sp. NPDC047009]|uniref:M48 family metallopeptidase n=1 Tax=unclassified Streptomyces TaxID=2593676 RepID=UPI0033D54E4C
MPKTDQVLHRGDAPELYALVDEVARVVGTRGVDEVRVDAQVNASVMTHGVRGRRPLTLGLPLWEILTPQQRIALLGHELAHCSTGDTRQGLVLSTAYRSLTTWHYYFIPIAKPSAVEMLVNLLYIVPRLLLQGVLTLLDHLTLRAAQRAEYLADREAARAASTEAAVGLVDRLLVTDSAAVALRREAGQTALAGPRGARTVEAKPEEIWERLRAHMASIPEYEYERQRRVCSPAHPHPLPWRRTTNGNSGSTLNSPGPASRWPAALSETASTARPCPEARTDTGPCEANRRPQTTTTGPDIRADDRASHGRPPHGRALAHHFHQDTVSRARPLLAASPPAST